jgi:hypothetical protein
MIVRLQLRTEGYAEYQLNLYGFPLPYLDSEVPATSQAEF